MNHNPNYNTCPGVKFPARPFNHRPNPPIEIDWTRYEELKTKGLTRKQIAKEMGINYNTLDGRVKGR